MDTHTGTHPGVPNHDPSQAHCPRGVKRCKVRTMVTPAKKDADEYAGGAVGVGAVAQLPAHDDENGESVAHADKDNVVDDGPAGLRTHCVPLTSELLYLKNVGV